MANKTDNYELTKPEPDDFYDVDDFNNNSDETDKILKDNADNIELHKNNKTNPHGVTAAQLGLGDVDNTADADKSVNYANSAGAAPWTGVSSKPTTLSGYGITDAVPSTRTINNKSLSSNVTLTASDVGLGDVNNTADNVKSVASAIKATQDESGNNIKAGYAASLGVSGKTVTLYNKNGAALSTITTQDTTYSTATTTAAGLESAADKTKLDGIEAGATKTTVDTAMSTTSTNPVQNKIIQAALDGKSATSHTHSYAGSASAGGAATSALACTGNSATATKLATARTMTVNLASTTAASFDGTANVTPGVSGTLPIARGGTGNTTGTASAVAWSGITSKPTSYSGYGLTVDAALSATSTNPVQNKVVNELFTSVSSGKNQVAAAITGKGVSTSGSDTFSTMATNIGKISTGLKFKLVEQAYITYTISGSIYTSSAINTGFSSIQAFIAMVYGVRSPDRCPVYFVYTLGFPYWGATYGNMITQTGNISVAFPIRSANSQGEQVGRVSVSGGTVTLTWDGSGVTLTGGNYLSYMVIGS